MIDYKFGVKLSKEIDKDIAFYARNCDAIKQWTRQWDDLSESEHLRWYDSLQSRTDVCMYSVKVKTAFSFGSHEDVQVGVCGFTSIDKHNQKAEFSLYINPEYQGRGYGLKALLTLIQHGFVAHNFNRIWGETFEGNPAAHIFQKAGLKCEGTMKETYYKDGRFIDSMIYAITRGDGVEYDNAKRVHRTHGCSHINSSDLDSCA